MLQLKLFVQPIYTKWTLEPLSVAALSILGQNTCSNKSQSHYQSKNAQGTQW